MESSRPGVKESHSAEYFESTLRNHAGSKDLLPSSEVIESDAEDSNINHLLSPEVVDCDGEDSSHSVSVDPLNVPQITDVLNAPEMTLCGLCLETDIPVFKFEKSNEAFKHFQDILTEHGLEPLHSDCTVCSICKHFVNKYYSFVKRILRAQFAVTTVKRDKKIFYDTLKTLDRDKLNLNLNLNCGNFECFDIGVDVKKCDFECSDLGVDVKNEQLPEDGLKYDKEPESDWTLSDSEPKSESEWTPSDAEPIKRERKIVYRLELEIEKVEDSKIKVESNKTAPKPKTPRYRYKPMPVEIMPTKLRNKTIQKAQSEVYTEDIPSEDSEIDKSHKKKRSSPKSEDEYRPGDLVSGSETATSSDSEILYDDNGKRMKKDQRRFPMECEMCDIEVFSKVEHYRHYLCYHKPEDYPYKQSGVFVCQHCGVTRTSISHLRNHEAVHGPRTVKCEQCEKKFFTVDDMRQHLQTHSKNYKCYCDYCNKGFHFKAELRLHIRTHTGEKPFLCHICGAGFAHKGNVGIHIRANHQGLAKRKRKGKLKRKEKTKGKGKAQGKEKTKDKTKNKDKTKVKNNDKTKGKENTIDKENLKSKENDKNESVDKTEDKENNTDEENTKNKENTKSKEETNNNAKPNTNKRTRTKNRRKKKRMKTSRSDMEDSD